MEPSNSDSDIISPRRSDSLSLFFDSGPTAQSKDRRKPKDDFQSKLENRPFRMELKKMVEEGYSNHKAEEASIDELPSDVVEKIVDVTSDHLEFTKLHILQTLNIALSPSENTFLEKFFVNTDVELDAELEYLTRYWREEFILRLKSRQRFLVDDYIPVAKPPTVTRSEEDLYEEISALKLQNGEITNTLKQREQEILVLEAMVERRERMIEENRKTFFKELLLLKEDHFKQLLSGSFEFLENEKLMDNIPKDMQTISMYYNAGAVLKGLQKIKALEEEIEQHKSTIENLKRYEKQFAAREEDLVNNVEKLKKQLQRKDADVEYKNLEIETLTRQVEELKQTVSGCTGHFEDLQVQLEEMEKKMEKKNLKIASLKNADDILRRHHENEKLLLLDLEKMYAQLKRFRRQARERDKLLVKISQLRVTVEDLEARLTRQYDQAFIVQRLRELRELNPFKSIVEDDDVISDSESSDDEQFEYRRLQREGLTLSSLGVSQSPISERNGRSANLTPTTPLFPSRAPLEKANDKDSLLPSESSVLETSNPINEDHHEESEEESLFRYSRPQIPRVSSAKRDSNKLLRAKSRGDIGQWKDNEDQLAHTPTSEYQSVHNLFSPSGRLHRDDLSSTFEYVADSFHEFNEAMSGFDDEPLNHNLLLSAEELKKVQKERAQHLLKQYHMLRKRDEIIIRLESRTKDMYERILQKKEQLEQEQKEQIEKCLNVFQLLSMETSQAEESAEMRELRKLKEQFEAVSSMSKKQSADNSRLLYSPHTVSDQIRPPSSFGVLVPGSQNRFHVVRRKNSIDEKAMEEMFVCRQVSGSTPPPRPQTSFAPLKRPHSSAKFLRPSTTTPLPRPIQKRSSSSISNKPRSAPTSLMQLEKSDSSRSVDLPTDPLLPRSESVPLGKSGHQYPSPFGSRDFRSPFKGDLLDRTSLTSENASKFSSLGRHLEKRRKSTSILHKIPTTPRATEPTNDDHLPISQNLDRPPLSPAIRNSLPQRPSTTSRTVRTRLT